LSCKKDPKQPSNHIPITDIDGNVYQTIIIGNQTWMAENLKVTHFRNGDSISNPKDIYDWISINKAAFSIYNDLNSNSNVYGKLYNYYAVTDERGICPNGWHIPDTTEWTELIHSLGGMELAGGKLKSKELWNTPNVGATNSSGFSALPAGHRIPQTIGESYSAMGNYTYFWSKTQDYNSYNSAFTYYLAAEYNKISRYAYEFTFGSSIRCIKDR
jgi:uncharacterized protein (TIGR02145 family)